MNDAKEQYAAMKTRYAQSERIFKLKGEVSDIEFFDGHDEAALRHLVFFGDNGPLRDATLTELIRRELDGGIRR